MTPRQVHSAHSSAGGAGIVLVVSLLGASAFAVGAWAGGACAGAAGGEEARSGGPFGAGRAGGAVGRCRAGGAASVARPVVVARIESGGVAGSTTTRVPTWTLP